MPTPSALSDLAYVMTHVQPLGTATGRWYFKTSGTDTGTVVTTSRAIDLSRALYLGATGGKPLDTTVHAGAVNAPPRAKSLTLAIPIKLGLTKTAGKTLNVYITVAHKFSTAAAGTYVTSRTTVHRFKLGTSTSQAHHVGVASSVSLQGAKKFYKANITLAIRKGSNTAAKDTTTGAPLTIFNPSVILSGADVPSFVPVQV